MKNLKSIEDTYEAGEISKEERDNFIHYYHLGRNSAMEEAMDTVWHTKRQAAEALTSMSKGVNGAFDDAIDPVIDTLENITALSGSQAVALASQKKAIESHANAIDALMDSAKTRGGILEQHTDVLEDLIATTKIQEAISQKQTSILEDLVLDYEKRIQEKG